MHLFISLLGKFVRTMKTMFHDTLPRNCLFVKNIHSPKIKQYLCTEWVRHIRTEGLIVISNYRVASLLAYYYQLIWAHLRT